MKLPDPPLLLITDRKQARGLLEEVLSAAFAGGCRWASVREKDLSENEQAALVRELHTLARRYGARLTLHGSAALAARTGVGGVHLPAGSDAAAARALLGPTALVGLSVHSPAEAAAADPHAVDYVVAGPAFETASKPGYGPALGEAGIAAIVAASRVPVVAIGGVSETNAAALLAAGASGLAVMGGVMAASDPASAIGALLHAGWPGSG